MYLYVVYVCIQENDTIASSNNTPDAHFIQLWFEAPQLSVGDILIHFMLTHWRMLMPCRRQRFTQLLTIPYVTLIVIHFG